MCSLVHLMLTDAFDQYETARRNFRVREKKKIDVDKQKHWPLLKGVQQLDHLDGVHTP